MTKPMTPAESFKYQTLKKKLLVQIGSDQDLLMQINGRIAQLIADGHSSMGALKRAAIEKRIPLR